MFSRLAATLGASGHRTVGRVSSSIHRIEVQASLAGVDATAVTFPIARSVVFGALVGALVLVLPFALGPARVDTPSQ
jgi:hypothetical protein